jgi:hypothetical protein
VAASDPRVAVTDVEVVSGDPVRIRCTVAPAPGSRLPAGGVEVLVAYKSAWSAMKAVSVEVPSGGTR